MTISDRITQDITAAMKARDEHRLSTLRMVKSALKNKEIDKRAPLDDKEAMQVLSTLIKQRKDSIEQFTKGGRQELADREAAEIVMIESYMPQAVGADEIAAKVRETIADMAATGTALLESLKDHRTEATEYAFLASVSGLVCAAENARARGILELAYRHWLRSGARAVELRYLGAQTRRTPARCATDAS